MHWHTYNIAPISRIILILVTRVQKTKTKNTLQHDQVRPRVIVVICCLSKRHTCHEVDTAYSAEAAEWKTVLILVWLNMWYHIQQPILYGLWCYTTSYHCRVRTWHVTVFFNVVVACRRSIAVDSQNPIGVFSLRASFIGARVKLSTII